MTMTMSHSEPERTRMVLIAGFDVSPNHFGAVLLNQLGSVVDFKFGVNHKGAVGKAAGYGLFLDFPKTGPGKDRQERQFKRLIAVRNAIYGIISDWCPSYVGLEEYAMGARGQVFHIGEVGGAARLVFADCRVPNIRLHDPLSVKMFAAHNGIADKDMMRAVVKNRWGVDFDQFDKSPKNFDVSGDLYDAYAIARLVLLEYDIRAGRVMLSSLHQKEIQTFNRTTRSYPMSLLAREWIRGDGR